MTTITVPTWFLYIVLLMWGTTVVVDILLLIAKRRLAHLERRATTKEAE